MGTAPAKPVARGTKVDTNTKRTKKPKLSVASDYNINTGSDTYRPLVTAAIDFGTTNSGFAFAFHDSLVEVQVNQWTLGSNDKKKTSTTVLLKEDKSFDSFGYTAEENYAELCESGRQKGWRYFHNFKMALYDKSKLSRNTELFDVENKPMPALEVLSIVISHLKQKILEAIRLQRRNVVDNDIIYVITVPAIWSDAAKQFMREAATSKTAGIPNDQLKLVLEPEAASVYCSRQRMVKRKVGSGEEQFQPLNEGHTYILVDIGGGTVDMATHEVLANGRLHEKYVARGNNIGGQTFNKNCLEFLEKLFGPDCFQKWKSTDCGDYLALERDIEAMKRKAGEREEDVKLIIRPSLSQIHRESTGGKSIEIFETNKDSSIAIEAANSKKGYIILKNSYLREFLKETAVAIETYLTTIIKAEPSMKLIFLVGGLAKSPYVRQYIESRFPDCRVVVPEDPGVAVLKGAVLLGNRPQMIASRLARYHYGIDNNLEFIPRVNEDKYKVTSDGKDRCDNVFQTMIEKGEVLHYGQRFTMTTNVFAKQLETKQLTFTTYLYQFTQTSSNYGRTKLGGFLLHPPEGGWPNYCPLKLELIVGEAEFKLQVSDDLGRKCEANIDFLLQSD